MAASKRLWRMKGILSDLVPTTDLPNSYRGSAGLSNAIFTRLDFARKAFATQSNGYNGESASISSTCNNNMATMPSEALDTSSLKFSVTSKLKVSPRHDLAMIYTCKVCETRSIKTVCRESYMKGVVVVRCDGCNNFHLIADRLGWFGSPASVEDFLASQGEEVKTGSVDTMNLTLEELAGRETFK